MQCRCRAVWHWASCGILGMLAMHCQTFCYNYLPYVVQRECSGEPLHDAGDGFSLPGSPPTWTSLARLGARNATPAARSAPAEWVAWGLANSRLASRACQACCCRACFARVGVPEMTISPQKVSNAAGPKRGHMDLGAGRMTDFNSTVADQTCNSLVLADAPERHRWACL